MHPVRLTPQQATVARMILRGLCAKEIGRLSGLAEGTVKVHTSGILRAYQVRDRAQLAAVVAARAGIDLGALVDHSAQVFALHRGTRPPLAELHDAAPA